MRHTQQRRKEMGEREPFECASSLAANILQRFSLATDGSTFGSICCTKLSHGSSSKIASIFATTIRADGLSRGSSRHIASTTYSNRLTTNRTHNRASLVHNCEEKRYCYRIHNDRCLILDESRNQACTMALGHMEQAQS